MNEILSLSRPTSQNCIFPLSQIQDIDNRIINVLILDAHSPEKTHHDCRCLLSLSSVNKCASECLDNAFFKRLFDAEHPNLCFTFPFISECYPNCCWKVIQPLFPTLTQKDDDFSPSTIFRNCKTPFEFKLSFLKESQGYKQFRNFLEEDRSKTEWYSTEYGSDLDPESPIFKAKGVIKECEESRKRICDEKERAKNALDCLYNSEDDRLEVSRMCYWMAENISAESVTNESILNAMTEEDRALVSSEDQISACCSFVNHLKESFSMFAWTDSEVSSQRKFLGFSRARKAIEKLDQMLEDTERGIARCCEEYKADLLSEILWGQFMENVPSNKVLLGRCLDLMKENPSDDDIEQINEKIASCHFLVRGFLTRYITIRGETLWEFKNRIETEISRMQIFDNPNTNIIAEKRSRDSFNPHSL